VLRIMNDSTDRAEDRGEDGSGQQEKNAERRKSNRTHKFSNRLVGQVPQGLKPSYSWLFTSALKRWATQKLGELRSRPGAGGCSTHSGGGIRFLQSDQAMENCGGARTESERLPLLVR
jgi:hypothetical protein